MTQTSRNVFITCSDTWMGVYAARALLRSGKNWKVNAAVFSKRNEFAKTLQREGATLVEWDINDVGALTDLMRGNDCCVIIPVPNMSLQTCTENLLTACIRAEIKDCILWSTMEADLTFSTLKDDTPFGRGKEINRMIKAVEEKFFNSSLSNKVILRLSLSIQFLFFLSDLIQDRAILPLATGTGTYAPVNLVDVGNVTAKLLSNPDAMSRFRNQTFTLTGNQLIDSETLAKFASQALNSKIEYRSMNIHEFNDLLQRLVSIGEMTEFTKDIFVYKQYCILENKFSSLTKDIKMLLDAEPIPIEKFFEENSQAFKPGKAEQTNVEGRLLQALKW